MGFFDGLQQWAGENRAKRLRPIREMETQLAIQKATKLQTLKEQQAAEALNKVVTLEQQKQQAQNPQVPLRPQTFGRPEELQLFQAYNKAGLDPKAMAEARTARLAADAFADAIPNVQTDEGKINIGLGKEYKPHVYRQNESKADEAAFRLQNLEKNFDLITDPLLALDVVQDKSIFDIQKAEIVGADGKTEQGFFSLTPSGGFQKMDITGNQGQPLNIPTETTKPTTDMLNTAYYAKLWGISEAEAAKILKSSPAELPEKSWSTIVRSNVHNPVTGRRLDKNDIIKNSEEQWAIERRGQPLPANSTDIINNLVQEEDEKKAILANTDKLNKSLTQLKTHAAESNTPNATDETFTPEQTRSRRSASPVTAAQSVSPSAQHSAAQPLTPNAVNIAWQSVNRGESLEKVQKVLVEQGFDISQESVNLMAIDAINSGVPANVMQQYLSSIGIQWKPE